LKNSFIVTAMKRFFASNKKKIIQFIYQSFGHAIGIKLFVMVKIC